LAPGQSFISFKTLERSEREGPAMAGKANAVTSRRDRRGHPTPLS
jgi:hypothetical protein